MKSILKKANLLLCCIIFSLLPATLYAQQYNQTIVKISQTPIDITTLAKTIAKQTGLEYSLNMQNASLKKQIKLRQGNLHLSDILKQIQQQAGLNYKIIGDHILFMDYQPATTTKPIVQSQPLKKKTDIKIQHQKDHDTLKTAPVHPDTTNHNTPPSFVFKIEAVNKIQSSPSNFFDVKVPVLEHFPGIDHFKLMANLFAPKKPGLWKDSSSRKTGKKGITAQEKQPEPTMAGTEREKWYKLFVRTGFSADELLYMNASLMAGIKYLYGIVSYGTGFTGGRFRWGGGIPVKLNDEQKLYANFTTGIFNRKDTSAPKLPKETLTRYGIAWSKTYNTKWTLQVQLHYNNLKKAVDTTVLPTDRFYYGKVPYSFSGNDTQKKQWIGIQVSLFYTLF